MQVVKITLEFNLADLVAKNEINVPAIIALTQPQDKPPPSNSTMERLRYKFKQILPCLSGKEHEILDYMLKTDHGFATYEDLAKTAWTPEEDPSRNCVRQTVHRLRVALKEIGASHVVIGSRKGVYFFAPTPVQSDIK